MEGPAAPADPGPLPDLVLPPAAATTATAAHEPVLMDGFAVPAARPRAEAEIQPVTSSSKKARCIGDAGVILKDPSTQHLIAHEVIRCLERCASAGTNPASDPDLLLLTKAVQLSVDCRGMLREGQFFLPQPRLELLQRFYPALVKASAPSAFSFRPSGAPYPTFSRPPGCRATPPYHWEPNGANGRRRTPSLFCR